MPSSREETAWNQIALFLLTVGILILCGFLLHPFLSAIVGAIVLAVVTQRPYDHLAERLKNRTAAAILTLIIVTLSIIVPGFILAQHVGKQAFKAVRSLNRDDAQQKILDLVEKHPAIASRIETATDNIDLDNMTQSVTRYFGARLGGFFSNSVAAVTQLVIMLFILFFLYRDRELALVFLRSILPLSDPETTELLSRVNDTIYATALGRCVIAAVQGCLAGLAFWVLGVPVAILWALLTVVVSFIPAFGSVLVWAPIAIYLGLTGHWGKAALLAVWGGIIVSTIDNFLYPILVGGHLRMHTVAILLSILGGVAVFGLPGLILGPVILTLGDTLLAIWRTRTSQLTAIS